MVESSAASRIGGTPGGRTGAKNKHFVKVVVIGDSFVGKTSLI